MKIFHNDPLYTIIQRCVVLEMSDLWYTSIGTSWSIDKQDALYNSVIDKFTIKYEFNNNSGYPIMMIDEHMVSELLLTYMSRINI